MNKILKTLTALLCGIVLSCTVCFGAACEFGGGTTPETPTPEKPIDPDNPENPDNPVNPENPIEPDKKESVSVDVALSEFAKAHGTVTLGAPADGKEYLLGETVTVTLSPAEGYEASVVTLNGVKQKVEGNTFTFTAEKDTTVGVTFGLQSSSLPAVTGLPAPDNMFGLLFLGQWVSVTDGTPIYVGASKLSVGEEAIASVTVTGSDYEEGYAFEYRGKSYSLTWLNTAYSVGTVLHLMCEEKSEYFVKNPMDAFTIEEHFYGEWTRMVGSRESKLVIDADSVTLDGAKADVIVDLGYFETYQDSFAGKAESHMYYFFIKGTAHFLSWYPEQEEETGEIGSNPTVDGVDYTKHSDVPYAFSDLFRGTWESLDGSEQIVISKDAVTLNAQPCTTTGINQYAFYIVYQGKEYEAKIYSESDYVLEFGHFTYDEMGLVAGVEYVYFVKADRPAVTVDQKLYGTWTSDPAGAADDIKVSAEGIFWGEDRVEVIAAGEKRSDGFTYTVLTRGAIYTLSYLNQWAGYDDPSKIPEDLKEWNFTLYGPQYFEFLPAEE